MNSSKTVFFLRIATLAFGLLISGLGARGGTPESARKSRGIIDTSASPYAKLHSVPIRAVRMGEGFWSARMRVNAERSIPTLLKELEDHGIMDNFGRLSGRKKAERRGPLYTDSDLYKWMEAAAFVLQSEDDPKLRATMDALTDEILAVQEPSGYLNTYYVDERKDKRFTEQYRGHELYCLGHMLQAGIAYYRATGNRKLLAGGIKFADYLAENFGPEKRPALTGHPELEMALVELYRTTGNRRYLDFAAYLLSGVERERLKLTDSQVVYMFSGIPFTARTQFEGHAVRAMYAASGATDYALETGDPVYLRTLDTLWRDMANHKLYITGGVGSRADGEAFGEPYELPNAQAYTESCAAIANMMWNWRMLTLKAEARFTDVIERALYNGINSGMSLSGTLYCYRNPLESTGEQIRNPWYDTTCCPPNLERTLASLPGYLYSTSAEGVYVHLFHTSALDWRLEGGTGLKLSQETDYPWNGEVTLKVEPAVSREFSLFLRIPGWTRTAQATVNGAPAQGDAKPGEYFEIRREWKRGDTVRLALDMAPRLVVANPRVRENMGRVAVERGPLVYCLEQQDQPGLDSIFDVALPVGAAPGEGFVSEFRPEMLEGILVLRHRGIATPKPLTQEPL
ncbi:MAG: glycoside hydrolase family 127 protein, partial [Acidobacteria bacterium]|nr:glycoside hydrolase family 127 protein [Acidobacteriota bacterium]